MLVFTFVFVLVFLFVFVFVFVFACIFISTLYVQCISLSVCICFSVLTCIIRAFHRHLHNFWVSSYLQPICLCNYVFYRKLVHVFVYSRSNRKLEIYYLIIRNDRALVTFGLEGIVRLASYSTRNREILCQQVDRLSNVIIAFINFPYIIYINNILP